MKKSRFTDSRILVVLDTDDAQHRAMEPHLQSLGLVRLDEHAGDAAV